MPFVSQAALRKCLALIEPQLRASLRQTKMSFDEAFELIGRDEAFRATVYAMNTLLTNKGVYTAEEFQALFIEHAINVKSRARI